MCVICPVVGGLGLCVENVTLSCLPEYMEGGRNIYLSSRLCGGQREGAGIQWEAGRRVAGSGCSLRMTSEGPLGE